MFSTTLDTLKRSAALVVVIILNVAITMLAIDNIWWLAALAFTLILFFLVYMIVIKRNGR